MIIQKTSSTFVYKTHSMNEKELRHLEISHKLMEMGQALMKEGHDNNDLTIAQTGSFVTLIGGLMLDEKDVYLFGQFCSMFSAKKILDSMESQDIGNFINKKDETFEELMKRINKIRRDNGHKPIQD